MTVSITSLSVPSVTVRSGVVKLTLRTAEEENDPSIVVTVKFVLY